MNRVIQPIYQVLIPGILLGATFAIGGEAVGLFESTGTTDLAGYLFLGMLALTLTSAGFWDVAFSLKMELDAGTLEPAWLTPTRPETYIIGLTLAGILTATVSTIVLVGVGILLFGAGIAPQLAVAVPIIALTSVGVLGIGYLIGAVVMRMRDANFFVDAADFIFAALSGAAFPIIVLPDVVRWVAYLLPDDARPRPRPRVGAGDAAHPAARGRVGGPWRHEPRVRRRRAMGVDGDRTAHAGPRHAQPALNPPPRVRRSLHSNGGASNHRPDRIARRAHQLRGLRPSGRHPAGHLPRLLRGRYAVPVAARPAPQRPASRAPRVRAARITARAPSTSPTRARRALRPRRSPSSATARSGTSLTERIRLISYNPDPIEVEVGIELDADFADIFEVRGRRRMRRRVTAEQQGRTVRFAYEHRGYLRSTSVSLSRAVSGQRGRFGLTASLRHGRPWDLVLRVQPGIDHPHDRPERAGGATHRPGASARVAGRPAAAPNHGRPPDEGMAPSGA